MTNKGARGGVVCWGTALQPERSPVRFPVLSQEFFIAVIFRPHNGPGVGSASDREMSTRNISLGVKTVDA